MNERIATTDAMLDHYRRHARYTDSGVHAALYDDLPDDAARLCVVLRNTILHMLWIGETKHGITDEELKAAERRLCVEFSYFGADA